MREKFTVRPILRSLHNATNNLEERNCYNNNSRRTDCVGGPRLPRSTREKTHKRRTLKIVSLSCDLAECRRALGVFLRRLAGQSALALPQSKVELITLPSKDIEKRKRELRESKRQCYAQSFKKKLAWSRGNNTKRTPHR